MTDGGSVAAFAADPAPAGLQPIDEYGDHVDALAAHPEGSFLAVVTYRGSKYPFGLRVYAIDPRTGQLSLTHSGLWHPEGERDGVTGLAVTRDCVIAAGGLTLASYRLARSGSLTLADTRERPVGSTFERLATDREGRWLFSFFPRSDQLASWLVRPDCRLEDQAAVSVPIPDESSYMSELAVGDDLIVLSHLYESWRVPPTPLRLRIFNFDAASGAAQPLGELLETSESSFGGLSLGPGRLLAVGSRLFYGRGYPARSYEGRSVRIYSIDEAGGARLVTSAPVGGARVFHAPQRQLFVADPISQTLYGYRVDEAGTLSVLGQTAVRGVSVSTGPPDAALVAVTPR